MFWVYGDNVVKRGFPMVGTIIIAINILIYLLMAGLWREDSERMPQDIRYMLTHHPHSHEQLEQWRKQYRDWYMTTSYHRFSEKWGAKASHVKQGHVMSLVSYQFVHGGFMHIFGNMLMMWALLGTLEITMGSVRFLIFYLLWGVAAGLAHVGMNLESNMGLVGASGAIAGMVGAYVIAFGALTKIRMVFFLGFKPIYFMIPTGVYVFLWALSQLAGMEAEVQYGGTGIAWFCHAGGFALGVATMLVFRRQVLSKMIRNKAGDLQALDDEEFEKHEKELAAKAEREGMLAPPEANTCPKCGYTVAPFIDNCPMCAEPVRGDAGKRAGAQAEEDVEEGVAPGEEAAPAPRGIRPWHIILSISGVMLLAAGYVALKKESFSEEKTVVLPPPEKEKPADGDFRFKDKPLSSWVQELTDENLAKRRETAEKLRTIDAEGAAHLAPLLAARLKDEDPDVRQLSAYVLTNIPLNADQAPVVAALNDALRDKKNKNVRTFASTALLKMGQAKPDKIAPLIQTALADDDPHVRRIGVYLHENIDPEGFRLAALDVRLGLLSAREGIQTKRLKDFKNFKASGAPAKPPAGIFKTVRYPSPTGELAAYVTPDPGDGMKRPAVLWAHGGFNGIGSYLWQARSRQNDQTASAFRAAGCVLMCPSWRNENDNPGKFSLFYGELDDLLAAHDYLAGLPHVDSQRIYLAGHDAGGTLVLLAAGATSQFRAVFSFGGAPDMQKFIQSGAYGNTPFDVNSSTEVRLRSATQFAAAITRPTFYFGGEDNTFGQDALAMEARAKKAGAPFHAFVVKDGTHYDILDPITRLIARKILSDKGEACNITFTDDEVQKAFAKRKK